jgi:hypothetical protein
VASFSRRGGRAASSVPRPPPRSHGPARGDRDPPTRGRREASAVAARLASVSSPSPGAWTTVTPSATPASTPRRAVPSRTMTTGSGSRDAAVAARTRSASRRVAVARSRHQPVGREPTTLAVSISSTTQGSRAARRRRPHSSWPRSALRLDALGCAIEAPMRDARCARTYGRHPPGRRPKVADSTDTAHLYQAIWLDTSNQIDVIMVVWVYQKAARSGWLRRGSSGWPAIRSAGGC